MSRTLCLRPSANEPCALVTYVLREPRTVVAVPARHLIERVGVDAEDTGFPAVWFDVATERARPVHVRLELVPRGAPAPPGGMLLGSIADRTSEVDVYGAYLGPASEEN